MDRDAAQGSDFESLSDLPNGGRKSLAVYIVEQECQDCFLTLSESSSHFLHLPAALLATSD